MALAVPDWSTEVVRKRASVEIRFRAEKSRDGSVAVAGTNPERPLTVDEIALLAGLDSPRVLPRALREQIPECDQVMARLVFDGLVEIRRRGRFITGAAALTIPNEGGARSAGSSQISELAMHYALAIRHLSPDAAAGRLYAFNSLPRATFAGDPTQRFASITGIDLESPTPRMGGREWNLETSKGWAFFRRGASTGAHFKLYLCPKPEGVSAVIPGFTEVLGRARSSVFKIAFPAGSLARADKIVAYLPSFEALQRTLSELARVGLEAPVQAVPFSAPVPGSELLSWGVDPPNSPNQRGSSWRSWVTRQVAECAHRIPVTVPPVEALDGLKTALQLRDIDPFQWLPRQQLVSRKWRLNL